MLDALLTTYQPRWDLLFPSSCTFASQHSSAFRLMVLESWSMVRWSLLLHMRPHPTSWQGHVCLLEAKNQKGSKGLASQWPPVMDIMSFHGTSAISCVYSAGLEPSYGATCPQPALKGSTTSQCGITEDHTQHVDFWIVTVHRTQKTMVLPGMVIQAFNPAHGIERQVGLCEFKTSVVHMVSFNLQQN